MSVFYYLRNAIGFALQLIPGVVLILLPFDKKRFRIPSLPLVYLLFCGLAVLFSLFFPFVSYPTDNNLPSNLYMCAALLAEVILFGVIIRDTPGRKLLVFLSAVLFASVQYSLANILLTFFSLPDETQIYSPATFWSYLIITAVLLPLMVCFVRRQLKKHLETINPVLMRTEIIFLIAMFALFFGISAYAYSVMLKFQALLDMNTAYHVPIFLLSTFLLCAAFFTTVRLSLLRDKQAAQAMEAAMLKENYISLQHEISKSREQMHDMRQLLNALSAIVNNSSREEVQDYLAKAIAKTEYSSGHFCSNPCINGILQYYAGAAHAAGVPFHAKAACDAMPFLDTDLTVLLGNALENALRASRQYLEAHPEADRGIELAAGLSQDVFAVQIKNPCLEALISPAFSKHAREVSFLPAEAFLSSTGSGLGLRRMEIIAEKYDGSTKFCFDSAEQSFITRIKLVLPKNGSVIA